MSIRGTIAAGVLLLMIALDPPAHSDEKQTERQLGAEATVAIDLLDGLAAPGLKGLVLEVLDENPGLAVLEARARAAVERLPQVKALPDPKVSMTAFLEAPETRTGPQRLSVGVSQGLPWAGKRALKERAAAHVAAALALDVEVRRLSLITETRRLYQELAFLERAREIAQELRLHLVQHEEIARARYSTGAGSGQGVVKLQAAITRSESELLDTATRRATIAARINALRDAETAAPLPTAVGSEPVERPIDPLRLLETAVRLRPEVRAARERLAGAEALVALAEKGYRPDFTLGLAYTAVGSRDDLPGRLQPPPGNGDDIFGIQAGISLPVWRQKLAATVTEATESEHAAREAERDVVAGLRGEVGDLAQRLPLAWRRLRLIEDLLIVQAEEAVASAEAGYVAGTLNALDLLDAEHVLFEARTARARAAADYLVGLAQLEGAIASSLPTTKPTDTNPE